MEGKLPFFPLSLLFVSFLSSPCISSTDSTSSFSSPTPTSLLYFLVPLLVVVTKIDSSCLPFLKKEPRVPSNQLIRGGNILAALIKKKIEYEDIQSHALAQPQRPILSTIRTSRRRGGEVLLQRPESKNTAQHQNQSHFSGRLKTESGSPTP